MTLLHVMKDILLTLLTLGGIWHMIGGRRAFRNPWVYGSLLLGLVGSAGLLGLSFLLRDSSHELSDWLGDFSFALLLCGAGWAWAAGMRRLEAVNKLLGDAAPDDASTQPYDDDADEMAVLMGSERLAALHSLIAPLGGAPGYAWLTPEWVDARLDRLRGQLTAAREELRDG